MGKYDSTKICLMIGAVVAIAVIIYYCMDKKSNFKIQQEHFTGLAAGAITNVGTLSSEPYDLIEAADSAAPTAHFADLVDQGDHLKEYVEQPRNTGNDLKPSERLQRVQGNQMLPRVSSDVTPYNIDIANPKVHMFMAGASKVSSAIKSKYADYDLATAIRGTVPITIHPNIPLISKTHLGRDDVIYGLFTPEMNAIYNKYTGKEYKNFVQHVAGSGQAGGYGGASGGIIMDHN